MSWWLGIMHIDKQDEATSGDKVLWTENDLQRELLSVVNLSVQFWTEIIETEFLRIDFDS
jgi:hypothetical protein